MQKLCSWYFELEADQQEGYGNLLDLTNDLLEIFANCYIISEDNFDKYFEYEHRYLDKQERKFVEENTLTNCLCIKQLNSTTFTAFYFSHDNEKLTILVHGCTLNELELVLQSFRLSADRCQLAQEDDTVLGSLYDKLLATQSILPQYRNLIEQVLDDIISVISEQPLEKMFYD